MSLALTKINSLFDFFLIFRWRFNHQIFTENDVINLTIFIFGKSASNVISLLIKKIFVEHE